METIMQVQSETNLTKFAIHTVVPELKLGEFMVSADRKSTKDNKLTDAQRIRRIVIPATLWNGIETTLMTQPSLALSEMLLKSLRELAGDRLREELNEGEMIREVDSAKFTVSSLLTWNKETASSRGMLTLDKDEVLAWFETSETRNAIATKHGVKAPAILAYLRTRFGALAARNHGLTKPEDAAKLMSIIADSDATGEKASLVTEILARLNGIQSALQAKLADGDAISMDAI
jgi:hypothetical protein